MKSVSFNKPIFTKIGFTLLLVLFGILMYKLNDLTIYVVDDYLKYQAAVNIHSIEDMYQAMEKYYLTWSGRVWGEFFSLLFLSMPKSVFNVANSIIYVVLLLLIYAHITRLKYWSIPMLIYINFGLWVFLPAFGQDILWLTGAGNYLWTIITPLIFLFFYRNYKENSPQYYKNWAFGILLFILGLFSGWANENFSVAIIVFLCCYIWHYRKEAGSIPAFSIVGLLGVISGSLIMWFAPGNFIRYAAEGHQGSIIKILGRIPQNMIRLVDYETTLFLVLAFVCLYFLTKQKFKSEANYYFIGSAFCAIAMSAVGGYGSRIAFSGITLMIISVGILIEAFLRSPMLESINKRALLIALSLVMLASFGRLYKTAVEGAHNYTKQIVANEVIIKESIARGEKDIYVNPVVVMNRYCAAHGLEDLHPQSDNKFWLNKGMAAYYKVRTMQSKTVQ